MDILWLKFIGNYNLIKHMKNNDNVSKSAYNDISIPKFINPRKIISAFQNEIDELKVKNYSEILHEYSVNPEYAGRWDEIFPPILGFPSRINEEDIGSETLSGDIITEENIGEIYWNVTDGHHRSLAYINQKTNRIPVYIDKSTITNYRQLKYRQTKLDRAYEITAKLMESQWKDSGVDEYKEITGSDFLYMNFFLYGSQSQASKYAPHASIAKRLDNGCVLVFIM